MSSTGASPHNTTGTLAARGNIVENGLGPESFNVGVPGVPLGISLGMTPEELAAMTHENLGPRLLATIWPLISLAVFFMCLRIHCKFKRGKPLWLDDAVLIGAWLCLVTEAIIHTVGVIHFQYGIRLYDFTLGPAVMSQYWPMITACGSLSMTTAAWSKTSVALTLHKLLTDGWMKWLVRAIIVSLNVILAASATLYFVRCTPLKKSWDPLVQGGECFDPATVVGYQVFAAGFSASMDLVLALIPWKMIWGLQMRKQEKIGISIAMSCGVIASMTSFIRMTKIADQDQLNPNLGVQVLIWGQAENVACICGACIPMLRVLVRDITATVQKYKSNQTWDSSEGSSGAITPPRRAAWRMNLSEYGTGTVADRLDMEAVVPSTADHSTTNIITIKGGVPLSEEEQSKRATWDDPGSPTAIMQTNEIKVRYEWAGRGRSSSDDYDMESLGQEKQRQL